MKSIRPQEGWIGIGRKRKDEVQTVRGSEFLDHNPQLSPQIATVDLGLK